MRLVAPASSQKLIQCLTNLEDVENHSKAKMELMHITSELMPAGVPQYLQVVKYPPISQLVKEKGYKVMLAFLTIMVKDFCGSINVVRNMNEDQMIETAAMLLDECDNFRLEDYVMMFNLAKKGKLFKIFDHLDIQVVTAMLDAYWIERRSAAVSIDDGQEKRLNSLGNTTRILEKLHPEDKRLQEKINGFEAGLEAMKASLDRNF